MPSIESNRAVEHLNKPSRRARFRHSPMDNSHGIICRAPNCIECGKSTACFYRLSPQCAMPANSIESPTTNQIQPTIRPPTGEELRGASRARFERYRRKVRRKELPGGPIHSSADARTRKEPRALGHATCLEVFQAALSVSLADALDSDLGHRGDADRPSAAGRHQVRHRLWHSATSRCPSAG